MVARLRWAGAHNYRYTVVQLRPKRSILHHSLNGSSDTVLTATFNCYGNKQISTFYKINTPEPIDKKISIVDYVRDGTLYIKFGTNIPTDGFWENGWNITKTRCWHVTISCQPDGRPPQPVRPWKSGRVHLADASNVVVLYSTEFGRDSRKFASGVRKYGKFSHFLTHHVVYYGQGKKQILSSLSAADVYRLSHVKVSAFSHSRDIGVLGCLGV